MGTRGASETRPRTYHRLLSPIPQRRRSAQEDIKSGGNNVNKTFPSSSSSLSQTNITTMSSMRDEYESVGERGAYRNAVLASEAARDTISSPRVTTIIPSSPVHIATPPPVLIPSADMIREAPDSSFVTMLESIASAATRIEMIEEPIDYHREPEVENDEDPGLPYFPNNPASLRFYPLYIPRSDQNDEKVLAPYIYYRNHSQEVVGCMKRGSPPYAAPVYIHTPNPVQLPIPLTNTQIRQFARDDPRAYAIDEVLRRLEDPRIDAEVSRLRDKLRLQDNIQKQLDDVRRQERTLVGAQFDVEQTIDGIRDRMERACLYQTLADAYARMVVRPSPSPSDRPLGLRARGPSKCHNCMTNPADVAVGSAE